jgi:hypothetical protein
MSELTPGGNPVCGKCGRWYGPGDTHVCPTSGESVPQVPLGQQFAALLWDAFHVDIADVIAIRVTNGHTVEFEMGRGANSHVTFDVTPVGKRGPRNG